MINVNDKSKIILALHKGGSTKWWKRATQNIIKAWTKSEYCHAELYDQNTGLSFSARGFKRKDTSGKNRTGVFWAKINYSHPERWLFLEIPDYWYHEKYARASVLEGKPYSYKAAMFGGNGYFCFKVCRAVLDHHPFTAYGDQTLVDAYNKGAKILTY